MISIMVGNSAIAGSFEYKGLYYNTLTDSTVEVINPEFISPHPTPMGTYNDSIIRNGKITIPSTVTYFGENFNVVRIGNAAFRFLENVREYEIPSTITSIGNGAFTGNTSLESITIPEKVTSISDGTFMNTYSLKSIELRNNINFIGNGAFEGSGLISIILPNSITSIEPRVFSKCNGLTEITIPDNIEIIYEHAFEDCSNLKNIHLGMGVKEIKEDAFDNCENLSIITINEDNPTFCSENNIIYSKDKTKIHFCAPNQIGNYVMPNTVEYINQNALYNSKFYSIKFSENLKNVYKNGLSNCTNLMALILPNSLTTIGYMSTHIRNLKYLVLREKFYWINEYNDFGNLEKIICYNINPPKIAESVLNGSYYANIEVYVPESAIDAYKANPRWSKFKEIHGLSDDELIFRPVEAIGFEYNKMLINKNDFFNIGYTIYPKNATLPILRWEVSNPEIVKIDTDLGKGMGLSEGTCTITVYSIDGSGIDASFEVEVKDNAGIDDALDEPDSEAVEYYNIHGIKLMQPTKGVNIVKYKDGTVRKVYNR